MPRPLKLLFGTIAVVLILFIVLSVLAIMLFPKERVIAMIESQGTAALGMPVDVGDAGISIAGLPAVKVINITVGPAPGQTEPVAVIPSVRVQANLFRLIRGQIEIVGIEIREPRITFAIPAQGAAAPPSRPGPAGPPNIPFPLTVNNVSISGGMVIVRMNPNQTLTLEEINQTLSLSLDNAALEARGNLRIGNLSLTRSGTGTPVTGISVSFAHEVSGNIGTGDFTLETGELNLNGLTMNLTGNAKSWTAYSFALTTGKQNADKFIAAVPPSVFPDRDKLSADGTIAFSVEGSLDTSVPNAKPTFMGKLDITEMKLAWKGFSQQIENISASIAFTDRDISIDNILVASGETAANVRGIIGSWAGAPDLNLHIGGTVRADDFTQALPLLTENDFRGRDDLELDVRGKGFDPATLAPSGFVMFRDLSFKLPGALRNPAELTGRIAIAPAAAVLENLRLVSGKSDFLLAGSVTNYLTLLHPSEQTAVFNGSLNSSLADIVDLFPIDMSQPLVVPKPWDFQEAIESMPIPPALSATLKVAIKQVLFDNLAAESVRGTLTYDRGVVTFNDMAAQAYKGTMTGSTRLDFSNPQYPVYEFSFTLGRLDSGSFIAALFNTRNFFRGNLSGNINLAGAGLDSVSVLKNLTGNGAMVVANGEIDNWDLTREMGQYLKFLDFNTLTFDTIQNTFRIENQKIYTPDMRVHMRNMDISLDGVTGFDTSIDYTVTLGLNRELSQRAVESLLSVNVPGGVSPINLDLRAEGTLNKPVYKLDTQKLQAMVGDRAKQELKSKAEDLIQKNLNDSNLQQQGKDLIDKLFR